jgi:hypothetical protein
MGSVTSPLNNDGSVRLQISVGKLLQLIESGNLCATDFSCLDHQSKNTIKELFLQCCVHSFRANLIVRTCRSSLMTDSSNLAVSDTPAASLAWLTATRIDVSAHPLRMITYRFCYPKRLIPRKAGQPKHWPAAKPAQSNTAAVVACFLSI